MCSLSVAQGKTKSSNEPTNIYKTDEKRQQSPHTGNVERGHGRGKVMIERGGWRAVKWTQWKVSVMAARW